MPCRRSRPSLTSPITGQARTPTTSTGTRGSVANASRDAFGGTFPLAGEVAAPGDGHDGRDEAEDAQRRCRPGDHEGAHDSLGTHRSLLAWRTPRPSRCVLA